MAAKPIETFTRPEGRGATLTKTRNLKMARSPHACVRGNTVKFYEWLESLKSGTLPDGPPVWICGDCHVGSPVRHDTYTSRSERVIDSRQHKRRGQSYLARGTVSRFYSRPIAIRTATTRKNNAVGSTTKTAIVIHFLKSVEPLSRARAVAARLKSLISASPAGFCEFRIASGFVMSWLTTSTVASAFDRETGSGAVAALIRAIMRSNALTNPSM